MNSKKPGSWATVLNGQFAGREGKVVDFIQEERDGIPVPNGLTYHVLQFQDTPSKVAFHRDEIELRR